MTTVTRFTKLEYRTARNHFATMTQESFKHLFQVEQTRLTIQQGHHIHSEGIL